MLEGQEARTLSIGLLAACVALGRVLPQTEKIASQGQNPGGQHFDFVHRSLQNNENYKCTFQATHTMVFCNSNSKRLTEKYTKYLTPWVSNTM